MSTARVLFLASRTEAFGDRVPPHGSGAHVAATLTALRANFDVHAVFAEQSEHSAPAALRRIRQLLPARVRGTRQDLLLLRADRGFFARALGDARDFEPQVVYERSEYLSNSGLRIARQLGVPFVLEVNGVLANDARTMYRSLLEPLGVAHERRKVRRADAIVAGSAGLADLIAQLGVERSRVTVVPNSVPENRIVASLPERSDRSVTIGWIGHLMDWHADALLRLVGIAPAIIAAADVRFVIIGDGPRLAEVIAAANVAGVADRFEFTGAVPYEEVPSRLAGIDVGVIPDVFSYAFPVKLVEFGAVGIPLVAPQSQSFDTQLDPGREYLPFVRGDDASLRDALLAIVRDAALRARLGQALHKAVRERYTWSVTAERLRTIVEGALSARS